MTNLMDLLKGQLSEKLLDQLGSQVGANREQTSSAASGIFTTLLGALSNNTKSKEGASSLASALDKDHDGSILNDLAGMLGGRRGKKQNARTLNGAGILKNLLGSKQGGVIEGISKMAGLDKSAAGGLLMKLATMVMGVLGKAKKEQNLSSKGLTDFLSASRKNNRQPANSQMDMITQLLDRDGDGDIKDDIASFGFKALMGFFKRRR